MSELVNSPADAIKNSNKQSIHFDTIKGKVPDWLVKAPSDTHRALRQAGSKPLPWFEQARLSMPDIARQLQQVYVGHWLDEQALNKILARLPAPEVFAEPLLVAALKERFGLDIDVRNTYLVHAKRATAVSAFASLSTDPIVQSHNALKAATQTLLHAALQNFEASEAEIGGMDQDERRKAAIYYSYPIKGIAVSGSVSNIPAEQFAALCRELDLGGKYQALIKSVFNPPSKPGDAPDAAAFNLRGLLKSVEQSAFRLQVHLAYMRKDINKATHGALLEVARNKAVQLEGKPVTCSFLRLWDVELTGIVAIGKARDSADQVEKIVVYIPDDPVCPLKEYASTAEFTRALRDRMLLDGYLNFFQRFVPARPGNELFSKIEDCLRPQVWNKEMGWYERRTDKNAKLHLRERAFAVDLFSEITKQKATVLKDDALFHAVPTAIEDQKTFDERVQYFKEKAFQVLNVAAFVVPGLGEVMLGVTAIQLGYETFEGIESWARGEQQQAWGYLMDVLDNVALMAALAAAGGGGGVTPAIERIAVEAPSFIEELKAVELPNGETRLWKPDLAPFAHDIILPGGLKPDEFGLYHYQGKTWLALEDKVYSVKPSPTTADYHLEHPTKAITYEPSVRHNGAGAWQHELDQPLEWEGLKLFRRLGHSSAEFSDVTAQRILRVSDTHEAVLRRVLSENQRPPALLEDTMRRFELDQEIERSLPDMEAGARAAEFDSRYRALSESQVASVAVIERVYPGLPTPIAEELVRHASPAEWEQLAQRQVPARIAEEARVYQQQVRLARAYEGLYLESVNNPDTDKLILHTLERLSGWSSEVRIEVRNGSFRGPLIDSAGPIDAPIRKVLSKDANGYQTHDADGNDLHGRDDLYASVLHALPDAQRVALGFPGVWDGPKLKRAVQENALLPRQTLRQVLQMQPIKPGSKSPMRLADGRLGYPLSGEGATSGYILKETLLDMIRWVGLQSEGVSAEDTLTALEGAGLSRQQIHDRLNQLLDERQALERSVSAWGHASASIPDLNERIASRTRIHDAIWRHWSDNNLPEIGRTSVPLRLERVSLADFPEQLPDFVYQRVDRLQLVDISINVPLLDSLQVLRDARALEQFFRRFAQVTSLEISRVQAAAFPAQPLAFSLPRLVADSFPELRELRLINQNIILDQQRIDVFSTLRRLEWLDLSGNVFSSLEPRIDLNGMRLRYLGLDRIGLNHWPFEYDSRVLEQIDELSLRDNRLTELPTNALNNGVDARHHTLISLQGNALSRGTILRIGLREGGAGRRFRVNLDVPPALQANLDALIQERALLREDIDNWAQASSSKAPLSDERVLARSRIGETILEFWRTLSEGQTFAPLRLEGIALADFPRQLPTFLYTRIRNVQLSRVTASPSQLNQFLRDLRQLTNLELSGHVQPLTELPSALLELPALNNLSLLDQGLVVDQQAMEFFARMPGLESLDLDGNRLGQITDVPSFAGGFRWLSLSNTGLQSWPDWVDGLMPLESLVLDGNQLTELPEYILENPRNDDAQTEISVRRNPLTHDTMYRAHVSEAYGRSYTFHMDLPEDIRAIEWHEPHDSDSDASDSNSSGHLHSPAGASDEEVPDVDAWLLGTAEENEVHRTLWQQLENATDAGDLLGLVGRLTQAAPYRAARTRADFAGRVWRVLEVAAHSTEDRLLFNGMAQEALVQPGTGDQTCHDGAWLVFNQIEIRIFTEQSLKDVPATLRGQTLYRLTRRLYRLQELDNIAREQAGTRDEAEVRLAYRLRWASELDLPLPPSNMLYEALANIRPGELDGALARVQQGESGEPFMRYAAHRDFWVEYLREVYATRFEALQQAHTARLQDLPDQFPGRAIDELAEQFAALQRQFEAEEQNLIRELTNREGLDHG